MTVQYQDRRHQPTDPHLALAGGVLRSAAHDVTRHTKRAGEAAEWLGSDDCAFYCDALGLDHEAIKSWLEDQQNKPNRKNKEFRMTDQTNPPTATLPDISSELAELDQQGKEQVLKDMQAVIARAQAGAKQRAQKPLLDAYRAEMEPIRRTHSIKALHELQVKYRALGLDI